MLFFFLGEIGEKEQQQQPEAVGPTILPIFFVSLQRRVGLSFSLAQSGSSSHQHVKRVLQFE
jgi:hypothetical protein